MVNPHLTTAKQALIDINSNINIAKIIISGAAYGLVVHAMGRVFR
jgi:hypothetical protein